MSVMNCLIDVIFLFFFCLGRSVCLFSPLAGAGHSGGVQEDDVVPSAPPLDLMDQVGGYESTSFDAGKSENVEFSINDIASG
jgi:hypothetical protein